MLPRIISSSSPSLPLQSSWTTPETTISSFENFYFAMTWLSSLLQNPHWKSSNIAQNIIPDIKDGNGCDDSKKIDVHEPDD